MPSSTPRKKSTARPDTGRIEVEDREHARRLSASIFTEELQASGGTPGGFADWLYASKTVFYRRNAVRVVRAYQHVRKQSINAGIDFDAQCQSNATLKESSLGKEQQRRDRAFSIVVNSWLDPSLGMSFTLACIELCFGGGVRFSESSDGSSISTSRDSNLLQVLIDGLEALGGPDEAMRYKDQPERYPQRLLDERRSVYRERLEILRRRILIGEAPSDIDLFVLTDLLLIFSELPELRTLLRTELNAAQMKEKIESATKDCQSIQAVTRRGRGV